MFSLAPWKKDRNGSGALATRADGSPGLGLFDEAGKVGQSIELGQARGLPRPEAE